MTVWIFYQKVNKQSTTLLGGSVALAKVINKRTPVDVQWPFTVS